jgi:preprotein translocase subunit YajC
MEYIIVAIVCFILGVIYNSGDKNNKLDTQIMKHLKNGERVVICIGDSATIFEMYGNKIRITRAVANIDKEPYDDMEPVDLVSGLYNKSPNNSESGLSDGTAD